MRTGRPAAAVFLGAFLLFQVQPLLAKLILPWFGGAAGVWTACVLFFQVALLLGYLYAHLLVRLGSPRAQGLVHVGLLALSLLTLPILPGARWQPTAPDAPVGRILLLLTATVGLPYAALSATSPLLSAWYARRTGDPMPYWLYAVSNGASFLALLGYPVLIEPFVPTRMQALLWSGGYALFALVCGALAWDSRRDAAPAPAAAAAAPGASERPPRGRALAWVALSACTSGLLLAVTAHLTQNVAPIPFLWVLPLALFLLSYVLTFSRGARYRPGAVLPLFQLAVLGVAYALGAEEDNLDIGLVVPLFCAALLLACIAAHAELARLRPAPERLTGFYLLTSVGGALGGAGVALAAPALLTREWELPLLLGALTLLLALASGMGPDSLRARSRVRWLSSSLVALGVTACLAQRTLAPEHPALHVARNFYGTLRVMDGIEARVLNHGTITHGEQLRDPLQRRQPTTYYGPDAGVGLALQEAMAHRASVHVGVVGLGVGTLAAYARPGDRYRFYELNPLVVDLARTHFSYLGDSPARTELVLGDARLSLAREPPQGFDVLVIDAFSSDAIPVHLLTHEAFALYARHLAPGGVLAVHVSNRHLELAPVVARAARAVRLRSALVDTDDDPDGATRRYGATWVLASARDGLFVSPPFQGVAKNVPAAQDARLWTDDYSPLLNVVRWRGVEE